LPAVRFAASAVSDPVFTAEIPHPVAVDVVCKLFTVSAFVTDDGVNPMSVPATNALVRVTPEPTVVAVMPDPFADVTEAMPPPPPVDEIVILVSVVDGTRLTPEPATKLADT
jgi:hypothetical protein